MTDQTPVETEGATRTGILPAIAAAMGDVQKVGKADRNKHDGYDFASIDNFLSLVNPICAKHGLVILSDEVSREDFIRKGRSGELPWMRVSFSFTVHHVSGQALPAMTRSVEVMRNGAQAYGSAQSYCLKQFLRGLFLIPTGDKDDADHRQTDEGEIVRDRQPERSAAPAPDPAAMRDRVKAAILKAETAEALDALWKHPKTVETLETLHPAMQAELTKAHADRMAAVCQAPEAPAEDRNADLGGDKIPY